MKDFIFIVYIMIKSGIEDTSKVIKQNVKTTISFDYFKGGVSQCNEIKFVY